MDSEAQGFHDYQSFTEKSIRLGFIRKVYSILCCQLAVTIGIMALFIFVEPVKEYSRKNLWLYIVSLVVVFILIIVLACCHQVRRTFPTNFILLAIFTVAEGVCLGTISSHYQIQHVLIAAGVTAIVTLGLTIFAFQTKIDFTILSGVMFVVLLVFIIFGIFAIFFYNRIVMLIISCVGALIFAVYIVIDTQLMMGGQHRYAISPEEYIFAALNLYLDIINLFIYILNIINLASD